jgi:hypothetical protein
MAFFVSPAVGNLAFAGSPLRAYYESVSSPEEGMHSLEIRLAWLLGCDVLPILPLVWAEIPG